MRATGLTVFLAGMLLAANALAQNWPARHITVLIPFLPGSSADIISRVVGTRMTEVLGQPLVFENRAGASGNIAMEATAKAAPDGYTIVLGSTSYTINLFTLKGTSPLSAFTPLAMVGRVPQTMVLNPQVPARNMQELVAVLKMKKQPYFAASGGPTGSAFFMTETFKKLAGVDVELVAYKGTGAAESDLLSGRVHMLFVSTGTAFPHYKSGKLLMLGITGSKRNPLASDVPTFRELGYPQLDKPAWFGFMGPAGLPRPIVVRFNEAANKSLTSKDVMDKLDAIAVESAPGTPEDLDVFLKETADMLGRVTKDAGIVAQ